MAGSIVGGIFGKKAADKQADAIESAAETASETQRYMFDTSVELTEPWRAGGESALSALEYELGLAGEDRPMLGADTRYRVGDVTFDSLDEAKEYRKDLWGGGGGFGGGAGAGFGSPYAQGVAPYGGDNQGNMVNYPGMGAGRTNWLKNLNFENADMEDWSPEQWSQFLSGDRSMFFPGGGGGGAGGAGGDVPNIEEFTEGGHQYLGFQKTPGYEFQLDEGQRAINRSLAARGKLLSGAAVKEGTRFAQGLADQTYSNHLARLAQLSGLGGGMAQQQGGFAMQTGQGLANTAMNAGAQIGNARASGYSALGQGIGDAVNTGLGFLMSDRRVKADVRRIGTTAEGYPKYEFRYLWDAPGTVRVGVMADEVPEEITMRGTDGYLMVNYAEVTI